MRVNGDLEILGQVFGFRAEPTEALPEYDDARDRGRIVRVTEGGDVGLWFGAGDGSSSWIRFYPSAAVDALLEGKVDTDDLSPIAQHPTYSAAFEVTIDAPGNLFELRGSPGTITRLVSLEIVTVGAPATFLLNKQSTHDTGGTLAATPTLVKHRTADPDFPGALRAYTSPPTAGDVAGALRRYTLTVLDSVFIVNPQSEHGGLPLDLVEDESAVLHASAAGTFRLNLTFTNFEDES